MGFPVVCIGASAGGLEAITKLLSHLPVDTGMAVVCIEHLDPTRHSMLTEILSKVTRMKVLQVENQMQVFPNHVYVIPPNAVMTFSAGILKLMPRYKNKHETHMPIDIFLESLAKELKTRAISVILSGSATDGSLGTVAIKQAGGMTFAQDEASAKFPEMPQSAIETGCVDFILNPVEIADALSEPLDTAFNEIVLLLKTTSQVDFTSYKPATIKRRIVRRMVVNRQGTFRNYLEFLKKNPQELEALHEDVLIKVTSFFRDPEIFDLLQTQVFPHLIENRVKDEPLRIWVPACSTGEEVYSLAIALFEHHVPVQFFGSDVKDSCIETARAGIYPDSIAQNVSEQRLKQFFNKVEQGYQITQEIRSQCIFAKQNVGNDPPFSRIDFISCRNLLIYLAPSLQKRVISIFHYALKPNGFLLLGPSESIADLHDLFKTVHAKARIYSKKQASNQRTPIYVSASYNPERFPTTKVLDKIMNVQKEADRLVMAKYELPGVVVNEAMDVIQFRGDTSPYLRQAPGTPSLNLLKMARQGLPVELKNAVQWVATKGVAFRKENIHIKEQIDFRIVSIEVSPLHVPEATQKYFLIMFIESPSRSITQPIPENDEVQATKAYMQSIIEDREAANSELQAANEELQSLNEEMQSANEELQTAKEELQASNEEITTVNDELNNRNGLLSKLNDDFINLTKSIQLPVVIVRNDLCIRLFTPAAEKIFNLVLTDIGRPLNEIKLKIQLSHLDELISDVIRDLTIQEKEVQDEQGGWYNLKIQPYRTSDHKIDGAVITFFDIDALKKNQQLTKQYGEFLKSEAQLREEKLRKLNTTLKNSNAELESFAAVASHDLQEPIRIVSMFMNLLASTFEGKLEPKAMEFIKIAADAAGRAQTLITGLLDYAKLDAKGANKTVVDIRSIVMSYQDRLEISCEPLPHIMGEQIHLERLIQNLISNAIKYKSERPLKLEISAHPEKANWVFQIKDNGKGFDPKEKVDIFGMFKRLAHEEIPGTGIGLAACKKIVERHGGKIWAESEPGVGSTFYFSIPEEDVHK